MLFEKLAPQFDGDAQGIAGPSWLGYQLSSIKRKSPRKKGEQMSGPFAFHPSAVKRDRATRM
jgi:hypothetical protein